MTIVDDAVGAALVGRYFTPRYATGDSKGAVVGLVWGTEEITKAARLAIRKAASRVDLVSYTKPGNKVRQGIAGKRDETVVRVLTDLSTARDTDLWVPHVGGVEWKVSDVHAKFLVADGRVAILGSSNFSVSPRQEVALLVTGPVVQELVTRFEWLWVRGEEAWDLVEDC